MSEYEEYVWLLSILSDLNHHYEGHNHGVLEQMIGVIKYRIELLT